MFNKIVFVVSRVAQWMNLSAVEYGKYLSLESGMKHFFETVVKPCGKDLKKQKGQWRLPLPFISCGSPSLPPMTFEKMLFLAKGEHLFLL